jgi:hypothetical protein
MHPTEVPSYKPGFIRLYRADKMPGYVIGAERLLFFYGFLAIIFPEMPQTGTISRRNGRWRFGFTDRQQQYGGWVSFTGLAISPYISVYRLDIIGDRHSQVSLLRHGY